MVVDMDVWLAPSVPGYQEVRDFHRRMADKLDWTPGSQMAMGQANVAKGMAEAYKEVSKLDGIPVYQTVTMNAQGQGQTGAAPQAQQQQPQQQTARPSLAGALGGLALGRKKQQNDSSNASSGGGNSQAPGSLMEMTTEFSGFSAGPVDDAQFAVPAGFKKVEPDQKRGAR
jgi:hypothetical protein